MKSMMPPVFQASQSAIRFGAWSLETVRRRAEQKQSPEVMELVTIEDIDAASLVQDLNRKVENWHKSGQTVNPDNDREYIGMLEKLKKLVQFCSTDVARSLSEVIETQEHFVAPEDIAQILDMRTDKLNLDRFA